MKTSRHPSSDRFPRHFRNSRLFRKMLKSQHVVAHDIPVSPTSPAFCTGSDSSDWTSARERKKAPTQIITEVEIAPPPPNHELSQARPAIRTTPQEGSPEIRNAQSVASLGTTVLTHLPPILPLPHKSNSTRHSRHSTYEPFSLDDIHLPRSASTSILHPPLRRRSIADNLSSYQPARPSTPSRYHRPSPLPALPTRATPLGSHPVQPPAAPSKPTPRRKDFSSLIATGVMSPIHEEPEPARGRSNTASSSTSSSSSSSSHAPDKRPASILRRIDSSDSVSPHRAGKKVRFEDEGAAPDRSNTDRLYLLPTVFASLLLVLAISEVIDSVRLEYALAFVVGCGIAHSGSAVVAEVVADTLQRARAEGWA